MKRLVGIVLGATVLAVGLAGCIVDPRYNQHHNGGYDHGGGYNRPYDEDGYHPPSHSDRNDDDYKLPTIVCASKDGRATRCRTDFPIKRAAVDKRYSGSPCDYGRTWGYDGNEVWVDRGCRARFVLTPAGRWR